MANDKKSSIYDDQSGAGSASELDEYGVWVKSDSAETSASKNRDSDFPIPDDESSPDFEIGEIEEVSADELDLPMTEDIDDFEKEFIPDDLENDAEDLDALSFNNILDPELDDIEELQVEDILQADPDFLAIENQKITEVPTIDALSLGDDVEELAEPASGMSAFDETASSESASEDGASGGETSQTSATSESAAISEEAPTPVEDGGEGGSTELFIEDFLDDSPFDDDEIPMEEEKDAKVEGSADDVSVPDMDAPSEEAAEETEPVPAETKEIADEASASAPDMDAPSEEAAEEAELVPAKTKEVADEASAPDVDAPSEEVPVEAEPVPAETRGAVDEAAVLAAGTLSEEASEKVEAVPAETEEVADEASASAVDAPSEEVTVEVEPVPAETRGVVDEASAPIVDVLSGEAKPEKPTAQPVTQTNLSTELLLRIAEELSSIRQELSTLKQDFLAIRAHESAICAPEPAACTTEPVENPPKVKQEEAATQNAQGGFFDDLDDEKIALTGNELDNILLSADFTEEIGMDISKREPEGAKAEAVPEEAEALQNAQGGFFDDLDDEKIALTGKELDNVLMSAEFTEETGEDLSEGAPEAAAEIEPAPETSEEAFFEIEEVILDQSTDSEELRRLQEEGVEPITPAPEDSSYLETDLAGRQELEVEDIDLSDVVIDEPDLSGQLQENPLQEPVLEAIAFDDMPLTISDDELPADMEEMEIFEQENAEEEPLLEIVEESADLPAEPVVEEYPVEETISEEAAVEPAREEYPVEESILEEEEAEQPVVEKSSAEEYSSSEPLPAEEEPAKPVAAIPAETASEVAASGVEPVAKLNAIPSAIQQELKTVLSYMDQLLESLPEEKIEEFAASKYFDTYKKLFSELGLV